MSEASRLRHMLLDAEQNLSYVGEQLREAEEYVTESYPALFDERLGEILALQRDSVERLRATVTTARQQDWSKDDQP